MVLCYSSPTRLRQCKQIYSQVEELAVQEHANASYLHVILQSSSEIHPLDYIYWLHHG